LEFNIFAGEQRTQEHDAAGIQLRHQVHVHGVPRQAGRVHRLEGADGHGGNRKNGPRNCLVKYNFN